MLQVFPHSWRQSHLPLAIAVACVLALWMAPLSAAGSAPPPLISLADMIEWTLLYLVCPIGALWLIVSAALKASQGHHGAGSGVFVSVICAVVLLSITVVVSYLRF
jgi:hypothetical protein